MENAVKLSYDAIESSETRPDLCPVIMMHGLFWNKFMLKDLAIKLSQMTQRKVFTLDLRNHGESPRPKECGSVLMAEDVKLFLDDMNLKRVSFVSHSFSSTVAYLVGLDRPECIEKIVMVDSPPFYEFSERSTEALVTPQVTIQNRLLNLLEPRMDLIAGQLKFRRLAEVSPPAQSCVYKKAAYDLTKKGGLFKWNLDMEFLLDKYKQQAFAIDARGSSDHEILIIRCPESARVTDERFEAMLRYNPNTKLVTMEDTTHLLLFEKPKEFLEIVKNYLCGQELENSAGK